MDQVHMPLKRQSTVCETQASSKEQGMVLMELRKFVDVI